MNKQNKVSEVGEYVYVTLSNCFECRFFVKGLSDSEYIKRAEAIYKLEQNKKHPATN
jgi:hypothetical protein